MKQYVKLLKGKGIWPDMGPAHRCLSWAALCRGLGQHQFSSGENAARTTLWGPLRCPHGGLRTAAVGCWHNGQIPPVLKHGPRSLTSMRVFGCQTPMRNESERRSDPLGARSTDPDVYRKDLSKSIAVGTRKMVNYA